jgi:6-phosphofructo-2-kinase / fructose-2,6-biphosphatase 4
VKMTEALIRHREQELAAANEENARQDKLRPLTVWTSTRLRTYQTARPLMDKGYKVRQRSQMSQINPGDAEKMSIRAIRSMFPEEAEKHTRDPYHHRYPRAESYHDLAVRLEPIILELEREQNDLLIIAHESVLRVLYAYLMHCGTSDIPSLKFRRDEIIEIIPAAYQNEAKRIHIPGLDARTAPPSPEDIRSGLGSAHGSGSASPPSTLNLPPIPDFSGFSFKVTEDGKASPREEGSERPTPQPVQRPPEKVLNLSADRVKDKLADED